MEQPTSSDLQYPHQDSTSPNDLTVQQKWEAVHKSRFRQFLASYGTEASADASGLPTNTDPSNPGSPALSYYEKSALEAVRYGAKSITIHLQHIYEWSTGTSLATFIQRYYLPLWKHIDAVVDVFVKDALQAYFDRVPEESNASAALAGWNRLTRDEEDDTIGAPTAVPQGGSEALFSHDMSAYRKMTFYALFVSSSESFTVRQLRCDVLGELITLRGTATRVSDVRPELRRATFECSQCHALIENVEQQFKFTEPQVCSNIQCKNRTSWLLKPESCCFADWQKLRLQENSSEIPAGSMPRVLDVILTRELCDRCKPGDKISVSGCLAAVPDVPSLMKPGDLPRSVAMERNRNYNRAEPGLLDTGVTGLRKLGVRDLGYRLLFFALDITTLNSGLNTKEERNHEGSTAPQTNNDDWLLPHHHASQPVDAVMESLGLAPELQHLFWDIANSPDTLDKLAPSIAPEIFGCENVKKGVLTMLVGGVEKNTGKDKLKLRGDINVCIVGDPGTAKSQILKFVHQFAGRAVYTAGNTSTAAGLTVSIHKDPDQGDSVIEAGALMLADKGICCIDEFDKMDTKDMVAIHEAMEQQTISVCKAGIQATLNARASILAACNPRNGRYDTAKSFRHNVRLSAPIISRFDLFFTMLDATDRDVFVAKHLLDLHMRPTRNILDQQGLLNRESLKKYLALARSRRPRINAAASKVLVDSYVAMRAETSQISGRSTARITVRQLESLIRLAEAVAKLHFSDLVLPTHVKEARRLMHSSLIQLQKGTISLMDDDESTLLDQQNGDLPGHPNQENVHPTHKGHAQDQPDIAPTTLDADEFDQITACLIDRIRAVELEMATATAGESDDALLTPVEAIVARDDLISWYIDNCSDPSVTSSEEALNKEIKKIERVINRMVNRDFTLIEEERDMNVPVGDGNETIVQRMIALRLHPNLATDFPGYSSASDGHHATLPTTFYTGDTPTAQDNLTGQGTKSASDAVQWAINDEEFMDYMYGWNDASAP